MVKHYSDIQFRRTADGFTHNLEADYAYFALWESARHRREDIRELLSERFDILLETEIVWSEAFFNNNANRLYEAPIFSNRALNRQSVYSEKIGGNRFILFVVKDPEPLYTFAVSVSQKVELSNLNIVHAKYEMRHWVQKDSGAKFGVHSTNSIDEFFAQVPLLLGPDLFRELLEGRKPVIKELHKDLEGAGGWKNYREVFQLLNLSCNYLVQRNFKELPESNPEKDLDLLTDNYQRLASVLGMYQSPKRPYKGQVNINNEQVSIDLRFPGDHYYDTSWEKDMLARKVFQNGFYIPREDDYFFSLFYHCKVQKEAVKTEYQTILEDLAKQLHFSWYHSALCADDKAAGQILNGYFQSQGYHYTHPLDEGVYKNNAVIKYLQKNTLISSKKIFIQRMKYDIKKALPAPFVALIKKALNK